MSSSLGLTCNFFLTRDIEIDLFFFNWKSRLYLKRAHHCSASFQVTPNLSWQCPCMSGHWPCNHHHHPRHCPAATTALCPPDSQSSRACKKGPLLALRVAIWPPCPMVTRRRGGAVGLFLSFEQFGSGCKYELGKRKVT